MSEDRIILLCNMAMIHRYSKLSYPVHPLIQIPGTDTVYRGTDNCSSSSCKNTSTNTAPQLDIILYRHIYIYICMLCMIHDLYRRYTVQYRVLYDI